MIVMSQFSLSSSWKGDLLLEMSGVSGISSVSSLYIKRMLPLFPAVVKC